MTYTETLLVRDRMIEKDVEYLFYRYHEKLGFHDLELRTGFPDLYAKDSEGRKLSIELESFLSHYSVHGEKTCDLIVCWEDDIKGTSRMQSWRSNLAIPVLELYDRNLALADNPLGLMLSYKDKAMLEGIENQISLLRQRNSEIELDLNKAKKLAFERAEIIRKNLLGGVILADRRIATSYISGIKTKIPFEVRQLLELKDGECISWYKQQERIYVVNGMTNHDEGKVIID